MQAADYQPRLSTWSHVWRLVVLAVISALAWWGVLQWQWANNRAWFFLDVTVGLITLGLVTRRRQYPFGVAIVANALTVVSGSAAGPAVLATVSLATRRRWREIIPVTIVALTTGLAWEALNPEDQEPWLVRAPIVVAFIAVSVGWGMYIGSRRELLATLRERAENAEAEQAARLARTRMAERSRIAREMHDVLAHRISLVTMHAGALSFRDDLTPEQVQQTAAIIQKSSHQALLELREVLGVLRDDPGDADPERPQPAAADIPELVEEARAAGMNIVTDRGRPVDDVPDSIGRTAYRIVQEGLTNARNHAPDTRVTVDFWGGPGAGLGVRICNPLRVGSADSAPGSGLGLVGLSERATLAGGELTHEVSPDHEFVLTAWLPWPP